MQMITVNRFLNTLDTMEAEAPVYRTGGSGTDGTCDCVGMLMGAAVRLGHPRYELHSSNYFARYQMQECLPIDSEKDCFPGMAVYKRRAMGSSGYSLNSRYLSGGRYFTGDVLDYYHIGVVRRIAPLRIIHCTKDERRGIDGIVTDTKLGSWDCGGRLRSLTYDFTEVTMMTAKAKIMTPNLGPVNLRHRPDAKAAKVGEIPCGAAVEVPEKTGEWATVVYGSLRGYVMAQFLRFEGEDDTGDGVTLLLPASAAESLYSALGSALGR